VKNAGLKFFANPITLDRSARANRDIWIDLNGFFIEFSELNTIPKESAEAMARLFFPFFTQFRRPLRRAALIALGTWCAGGHAADTDRYIRDWISVPLLASAAPESRTMHPGLVSGTPVTVLETNDSSGYTRVRTREGVIGWLSTRYLSEEPSARSQLEQANAELQELRALKARLADLPPDLRSASQQLIDTRAENARLQQEVADSRRTPSEAATLAGENTRLQASNNDLQQQLQARDTELQLLRTDTSRRQFRDGGLAVAAGMLLIVIGRRLWPKKRSEWS
jgi:SH3 domain protein